MRIQIYVTIACARSAGKLIHLQCDEIEEMQIHLFSEHRFKMNPMRTVFYGLCEQCLCEHRTIIMRKEERQCRFAHYEK